MSLCTKYNFSETALPIFMKSVGSGIGQHIFHSSSFLFFRTHLSMAKQRLLGHLVIIHLYVVSLAYLLNSNTDLDVFVNEWKMILVNG